MSKSVLTKTVSHNIVLNIMTDCTSNDTTLVDDPGLQANQKVRSRRKTYFTKNI